MKNFIKQHKRGFIIAGVTIAVVVIAKSFKNIEEIGESYVFFEGERVDIFATGPLHEEDAVSICVFGRDTGSKMSIGLQRDDAKDLVKEIKKIIKQ